MSPVSSMSSKGWKAVIDTNLNGTFLCCKEGKNSFMLQILDTENLWQLTFKITDMDIYFFDSGSTLLIAKLTM